MVQGESAGGNDTVNVGMKSRFCPQVCKIAITPISARRCFGSDAISSKVCALAANNRS